MHHRATFPRAEVLGSRAGDVERAFQVHGDDHVPVLLAHLVEDDVAQDAGDVDDTVDAAERVDGLLDHALSRLVVGDAVAIDHGLATGGGDFVADLLRRGRVAGTSAIDRSAQIVDHHLGALFGGELRHLRANATASAGHQHHFAV